MTLLPRILGVLLALGAIASALFIADSRTDRHWPISPTWPYEPPARAHWFYRTFAALPTEGARLGIWGWAAHAWVYTGTIPATRETSAEFAWRDWGGGYYRNRYLDALTSQPPEYFAVAVGPQQFMFNDRTTYGPQVLPGLQPFLDGSYRTVLDDGDAALLLRRDVLEECCAQGRPGPLASHSEAGQDWVRFNPGESAALGESSWQLEASRPARLIAIPIRLGPLAATGSAQAGILQPDGSLTGCEPTLAAAVPDTVSICLVEQPQGRSWRIAGRSTGAEAGTWIEVGRPFLAMTPGRGG